MGVDAAQLNSILSGNSDVESKISIVNSFKVEVKRSYIELDNAPLYFEALRTAIDSSDGTLPSVAFSCLCHLVKRIITQDPGSLKSPASIALPIFVNKLGDSKPSARATARRVFEDYWIACPTEVEECLRDTGLTHTSALVKSECLHMLSDRVQLQETKFAFRPFTPRVTALLNDDDDSVSNESQDLLISFFKNAHSRAKQDLHRELSKQGVPRPVSAKILKAINFEPSNGNSVPSAKQNPSTTQDESANTNSNINDNPLTLNFLTEQQGYNMEDSVQPVYYSSENEFREEIEDMLPIFEGKETEHNWHQREKNLIRLRGALRGNLPEEFREDASWMLKTLSDGIVKAVTSLRTSLSNHGCQFVKDAAHILGTTMDTTLEPYLSNLVRMTSSAKRITHQSAAMTVNIMIANTSYSNKYLNQVNVVMGEKVAQSKVYSGTWMRILICKHQRHKYVIENNNGLGLIEKNLQKGLADANPSVREAMRTTFWAYYEVWPKEGEKLFEKLDSNTKKTLDKVKPARLESESNGHNKQPSNGPSRGGPAAVGKASRSGAKDFVAKSRQQHQSQLSQSQSSSQQSSQFTVGVSSHNSSASSGLGGKPGRLGMPQRQPGARKQISNNNSTASSVKSFASSETKKSSTAFSNSHENNKLPPPKQLSDSSEEMKEPISSNGDENDTPEEILPTLTDLVTGIDVEGFVSGVTIISLLLRQLPVPDTYKCSRPISMPRPDIVSRVLQKAFGAKANGTYAYKDVINSLTTPDIINVMPQFVSTSLLLSGTVICSSEVDQLRETLKRLVPKLDNTDTFNTITGLISEMDPQKDQNKLEVCIDFLSEIARDIPSHSNIVENIQSLCLIKEKLDKDSKVYYRLRNFLEQVLSPQEIKKSEESGKDDLSVKEVTVENEADEDQPLKEEDMENKDSVGEETVEPDNVELNNQDTEILYQVEPKERDENTKQASDSLNDTVMADTAGGDHCEEENQEIANSISVDGNDDGSYDKNEKIEEQSATDMHDTMTNASEITGGANTQQLLTVSEETTEDVEDVSMKEDENDTTIQPNDVQLEINNTGAQQVEEDPFRDNKFKDTTSSVAFEPPTNKSADVTWDSPIKDEPKPKKNSSHITELNEQVENKLSIYEDEDDSNANSTNESNDENNATKSEDVSLQQTPSKMFTPTKSLRENNDTLNKGSPRQSWFGFETKKQMCLSPLPQKRDEASKLFGSLLTSLESGTIDSHGFRKLITIVRGSKTSESNSVAYDTWRQEDRQAQLQKGLLKYLNSGNLDEIQMNQGLLQLKQLLSIAEPGSFRGQELLVFESLLRICGTATSKTIIYGGLGETQEELVKMCKGDENSRVSLLEGAIEAFRNPSLNREQKVMVISTISKLLKTGNVSLEEIRSHLEKIGDIVIRSIADKETYVRKEAYPTLVSLRLTLVSPKDKALFQDQVGSRLSEGQQHLMEYYCKKKV